MTIPELFKPLESKRAFEAISEQIKGLICSGQLNPGDKLPGERELATLFKTGRMVVRESLRMLEQSGFIYIKSGYKGGAFVKDVGADVMTGSIADLTKLGRISLEQLTEARVEIESVIIGLAAKRMKHDDFEQLWKNIEYSEQLIAEGRMSRDGNIMFHLILAKGAKNYLLEVIIESVMNVVDSLANRLKPGIGYSEKILNAHKAIYDALRKKEVEAARKLMRDHLVDVRGRFLSLSLKSTSADSPVIRRKGRRKVAGDSKNKDGR
jgi:GntR family transcriptional regulator, transcriptional repressor for pyruvate dehydrogenase complex